MPAATTFLFSVLLMIDMRRVSKLQCLKNTNCFVESLKVIQFIQILIIFLMFSRNFSGGYFQMLVMHYINEILWEITCSHSLCPLTQWTQCSEPANAWHALAGCFDAVLMHLQHQISMSIRVTAGAEGCLIFKTALFSDILMLDSFSIVCLYCAQGATYWICECVCKKWKKKGENRHKAENIIKKYMKEIENNRDISVIKNIFKEINKV